MHVLLLLQPFHGITWVCPYQNKHSPTHTYPDHQSSFICFLHLLRSMASAIQFTCPTVFSQPLSKSSLVYLLVWHPPLHTPHISSPNHCLLFAAHACTIATSLAVVPTSYHLINRVTVICKYTSQYRWRCLREPAVYSCRQVPCC